MHRGLHLCLAACITSLSSSAFGHPSLYFDAAGLTQLKQLASEDADTGLGWNYAAVFQEIVKAADQVLASPYTYTVEIPNPNGQGSVTWTYSISSTMPPPHPNNPGYPPWTKVSRDL
ncbi:MAG TPA: hypothetical protein PKW66_08305 [Polyangiaceae bacterium]|nr:hypothetical protein [Polyangiaceae bacterium]